MIAATYVLQGLGLLGIGWGLWLLITRGDVR